MIEWFKANLYFFGWGAATFVFAVLIVASGRRSPKGVNWLRLAMYAALSAGLAVCLRPDILPGIHTLVIVLTVILFGSLVFERMING